MQPAPSHSSPTNVERRGVRRGAAGPEAGGIRQGADRAGRARQGPGARRQAALAGPGAALPRGLCAQANPGGQRAAGVLQPLAGVAVPRCGGAHLPCDSEGARDRLLRAGSGGAVSRDESGGAAGGGQGHGAGRDDGGGAEGGEHRGRHAGRRAALLRGAAARPGRAGQEARPALRPLARLPPGGAAAVEAGRRRQPLLNLLGAALKPGERAAARGLHRLAERPPGAQVTHTVEPAEG